MEAENRYQYLLSLFNNGTATADELAELERLLASPEATGLLQELWEKIPADARFFEESKSEAMLAMIRQRNREAMKIIPQRKRNAWPLLLAAACILAVTGTLLFIFIKPTKHTTPNIVAEQQPPKLVVPGGDKAVLLLDDGSSITLDSSGNGTISIQGATNVSKAGGQVIYALNDKPTEENNVLYNTLKTRRGGQYQLVLADGTRVWMNASSSLRFPTAFPGKERIVELTGEAYFEVAKDAQRPFSVRVNDITVNVLGTHFNVMAYENEAATAISLLEGAVNVTKENNKVSLRPGQQARLQPGAAFQVINNVNLEEIIAWKNGYFQLDHTRLDVLMRQVERWYDVDVVYQGKIPNRQFGGKIPRKSDIKEVMKLLELSNVYSHIEGNKITILDK
jgi:ferric-dicitrate binding protein FerR (iron transport regulator)